jgi:diaminopimelate epimerase
MQRFEKYHGLGNDFLVIRVESPDALSSEEAIRLCDRHFGVGGDGVLLVSPGEGASRARMTVLNADGSRPEMCGNGLRCVALYLVREAGEASGSFVVDTDAGPRGCEVSVDGTAGEVTTTMGKAEFVGEFSAAFGDESLPFRQISMGNPHAVCFRAPIGPEALDELGARLSGGIPGGSNIEVAHLVEPTKIRVDVWERGVGRTLACGTGAAATAVAAVRAGLSPRGRPIDVFLPGGPLAITVSEDWNVSLRGPAAWVYSGTYA